MKILMSLFLSWSGARQRVSGRSLMISSAAGVGGSALDSAALDAAG
jgi:hypothetical protein